MVYTDDIGDLMGCYDGYDGPTNEPDYNEPDNRLDREKLEFRYFFNAGLDKETGILDGEGSDIFERDDSGDLHYIGSLYGYLPGIVYLMSDEEFRKAVEESFVPTRLDNPDDLPV